MGVENERRLQCLSVHNEDTRAAMLSLACLLHRKGCDSEANRVKEHYANVRRTFGLGNKQASSSTA